MKERKFILWPRFHSRRRRRCFSSLLNSDHLLFEVWVTRGGGGGGGGGGEGGLKERGVGLKGHVARYPRYLMVTDVRSKKDSFFFSTFRKLLLIVMYSLITS